MHVEEATSYNFVASLTAQLRSGSREESHGVSGGVTSTAAVVSLTATSAASLMVASRMGQDWEQVTSVVVDALDIFA
jgi:hypothetical protein